MANKKPKKANLLDHHSIKHFLDESVSEIVKRRGYEENVRMSNIRLFFGDVYYNDCSLCPVLQQEVPSESGVFDRMHQSSQNRFSKDPNHWIRVTPVGPTHSMDEIFQELIIHLKEKNAILATYPPKGSFTSTGLVVSSKLPRFSDEYTLTIASADPQSISAGKPVQFTKSVTQWFTKDGVLVEGLFWKDVEALINDYAAEPKKS
ncbi:MICROSOMAL SIGNAL PEPTIDASE 25 KDA SUBUNIT [Salix purpurea]|uniref:Signal peptidase complex subunit 2 n=1 Tax=Salix purpurea TaxID=77065 RepID=A0A9Q0TUL6_SALPP|nr:MICROSOMAL SIGNAL PEPTIDASE 25 KDA SUBUNIT [Salix purpurea]